MSDTIRRVEIQAGFGKRHRDRVAVVPGNTYRIEPLNVLEKKNRGRVCQVTGFRRFGAKQDLYANVIWLDTGRPGWTDMGNFVEVKPAKPDYGGSVGAADHPR